MSLPLYKHDTLADENICVFIMNPLWLLLVTVIVLLVLSRSTNTEEQAVLRMLERKMHLLIAHLQRRHPVDPRTQRLIYNWDGHLTEMKAIAGAGTTTGKQQINICIRNDQGILENPMTATFICWHELSHVCTDSVGHTPEFWENMRWLLKEAEAAGLYTYENFEASPKTYCGSIIDSSPLTCVKEKTCV